MDCNLKEVNNMTMVFTQPNSNSSPISSRTGLLASLLAPASPGFARHSERALRWGVSREAAMILAPASKAIDGTQYKDQDQNGSRFREVG